jgi:hypothetical protein
MRGVKYNLVFHKPDQTIINMSGLSGAELITTIPNLFKTHYGYDIKCNKSFIQSLNTRPHVLGRFIREKVSISRIDKPKPSDNQPNTNVVQTNIIEQPDISQISV